MQVVLGTPGRALVLEIKTVSTPRMTDEIMDRTEPIKRAPEFAAEERMKALTNCRRRGDLECLVGTDRTNELFVALVRLGTSGECHSDRRVVGISSEEGEYVIGFNLELPVRLNHLSVAMSASRM